MKNVLFTTVLITALMVSACNNSEIKNTERNNTSLTITNDSITANTIQVYYFHGSIRCHTCVSVDENTFQYLKEFFPKKLATNELIFKSINIDKNEREDLIKKYEIYGQTLLFIKGDTVIDKTDEAFQYVTTNSEKWKQLVKATVNKLIN